MLAASVPPLAASPAQQNKEAAFEVATIKPTSPDERARYMTMQGAHQFVGKGYTLRFLV